MKHIRIDKAAWDLSAGEVVYEELLRAPAMSAGIYRLPAGAVDPQSPHAEDEIYFVLRGQASITSRGETRRIRAGDLVYIPAQEPHSFHDITEAVALLVLFAPAEGSPEATA